MEWIFLEISEKTHLGHSSHFNHNLPYIKLHIEENLKGAVGGFRQVAWKVAICMFTSFGQGQNPGLRPQRCRSRVDQEAPFFCFGINVFFIPKNLLAAQLLLVVDRASRCGLAISLHEIEGCNH